MMKLDLPGLPIPIQTAGEWVYLQVVKWANYTVSLISATSPYLQSTFRASLVLIGLNIAFFELSLAISRYINRLLNLVELYQDSSDMAKAARSFLLGSVLVLTIGGANHLTRQLLRLPLPVWKIAGIGLLTNLIWLIVKTSKCSA